MLPSKTGSSLANVVEQSHAVTDSLCSDDSPSTGKILDHHNSGTSSFLSQDTIKESSQNLAAPFTSLQPLNNKIGLHQSNNNNNSKEPLVETVENDDCWTEEKRQTKDIAKWMRKVEAATSRKRRNRFAKLSRVFIQLRGIQ